MITAFVSLTYSWLMLQATAQDVLSAAKSGDCSKLSALLFHNPELLQCTDAVRGASPSVDHVVSQGVCRPGQVGPSFCTTRYRACVL